jgi:hypothetical protein
VFTRFLATRAAAVATKNSGRMTPNGNSGITWYWFGCPYSSSDVTVFPTVFSALIMYVMFVPCGNAGIVPFQVSPSMFVISIVTHVPLPSL